MNIFYFFTFIVFHNTTVSDGYSYKIDGTTYEHWTLQPEDCWIYLQASTFFNEASNLHVTTMCDYQGVDTRLLVTAGIESQQPHKVFIT